MYINRPNGQLWLYQHFLICQEETLKFRTRKNGVIITGSDRFISRERFAGVILEVEDFYNIEFNKFICLRNIPACHFAKQLAQQKKGCNYRWFPYPIHVYKRHNRLALNMGPQFVIVFGQRGLTEATIDLITNANKQGATVVVAITAMRKTKRSPLHWYACDAIM